MTVIKDIKEVRPVGIPPKKKKEIEGKILVLQKKLTPAFKNIDTTEIIRRMRKTPLQPYIRLDKRARKV